MQKTISLYILTFTILTGVSLSGCTDKNSPTNQSEIAVTNSYLQCAVQDICGNTDEGFCLAPPGMCPGHFDISPSQVSQLSRCKMLLLFDFQSKVENTLSGLKEKGLKTVLIKSYPGMCIPQVYLDTCEEICNILSAEFPEKKDFFEQRLNLVRERIETLSTDIQTLIKDSGLSSMQIIASGHQSEFVNWLGLETVAKFSGSDSETPNNINNCLNAAKQNDVKFIIANKQEGTYLSDSLADRLNINTVIFSNFPDTTGFDTLVQQNVNAIIEAAQK
ncbi:MAG: zinc ABC transporter substrate-binding protein [Sedimentisphaerales bacterium]|nr:zinc ABC transporter substrate-binding protein [Sedimentisphaerales bacterium]